MDIDIFAQRAAGRVRVLPRSLPNETLAPSTAPRVRRQLSDSGDGPDSRI
jgi:hypothetical protein